MTAWLGGEPRFRIKWSQIELVTVGVMTASHLNYSEAFWTLSGEGAELVAPVEVVVNAEQLNGRLFALPDFNMEAYRSALEAEAEGRVGEFICWRKVTA